MNEDLKTCVIDGIEYERWEWETITPGLWTPKITGPLICKCGNKNFVVLTNKEKKEVTLKCSICAHMELVADLDVTGI